MPYKVNQERRHRIPKARYRVKNWRDYDAALCRRGDLTVWVTAEAIEAWTPANTGRRGRPQRYSEMVVETGLMLRLAFGRPWRQTEGMLASILRLLGLDLPVPDHTTFSRRSVDLTVAKAVRTATDPVNVVIDSTGLKVFGAGEWQREKHGGKGRRTWRKLHLAVDPDTGEILASELTTTEDGDASLVGPLLDQISGPIASVTADGAYDGDPVYRIIARAGSCRRGDHSTAINGSAERQCRDGAHPARPAPPDDPGAWSARLAKGGQLWPSVLGRGGDDALQDRDRSPPPRPDSADAKGRSRGRLQGPQHHDPPRHAGITARHLSSDVRASMRPPSELRTKVLLPGSSLSVVGPLR